MKLTTSLGLKAKEFLDRAIAEIALPGRQSDITKQVIFAPGQETLNGC